MYSPTMYISIMYSISISNKHLEKRTFSYSNQAWNISVKIEVFYTWQTHKVYDIIYCDILLKTHKKTKKRIKKKKGEKNGTTRY